MVATSVNIERAPAEGASSKSSLQSPPGGFVRFLLGEAWRGMRRCFQPAGLFLVILGPDGVGKSTLVSQLTQACGPCFRRQRVFHWRPKVIPARTGPGAPTTDPHGRLPRGKLASVAVLCLFFLDFWLGYLFVILPLLTRSGLVLFDRYFPDLLIDPLRYRYGGPMWLPKFLSRLVPRPDLVFVLTETQSEAILSRKREVVLEEVHRQQEGYRQLAEQIGKARLIKTDQGIERTAREASRFVVECMVQRSERYGSGGFAAPRRAAKPKDANLPQANPANNLLRNAIQQLVGRGKLVAEPSGSELQGDDLAASVVVSLNPSKRLGRDLTRQGYTRARRFAVMPSPGSPRWLFPLGNSRATREALRIYVPFAPVARTLKGLLKVLAAAHCQDFAPHKLLVSSRGSLAIESLVQEVTGEERAVFALSLGTEARFRKLTVQVMRPEGEILGYIKLPLTDAATERVRHEAEVLERLWTFPDLRGHIPRVLHAGDGENGYILFQTAGPSHPGPTRFHDLHEDFLQKLRGIHQQQKAGGALVNEVAARWQEAEPKVDAAWRALGHAALARAGKELECVPIPCGVSHGDFAPWNTRLGDGRLWAFDWESASWELPVWWDVFHFKTQVAALLRRHNDVRVSSDGASVERAAFLLYLLDSAGQLFAEESPTLGAGLEFRRQLLAQQLGGY